MKAKEVRMLDIRLTESDKIEVEFSADRTRLWININGMCYVRIQNISELVTQDGDK